MNWIKDETVCSVKDCWHPVRTKGWCNRHYLQFHKLHPTYRPRDDYNDRRKHPFYIIWWQRKQDKALCEKWLDFLEFVKDISPKPEGNYLLVRLRNEPFGPDNFKWQEHLKRKEGESKKEWHARKWAARKSANPSMDSDRSIKRKYGLNREQYDERLKSQNFVCAVCENNETASDARTGTLKKLAVDHCHKTGKIRALLCWRCNRTLGALEDDLILVDKVRAYLVKHSSPLPSLT